MKVSGLMPAWKYDQPYGLMSWVSLFAYFATFSEQVSQAGQDAATRCQKNGMNCGYFTVEPQLQEIYLDRDGAEQRADINEWVKICVVVISHSHDSSETFGNVYEETTEQLRQHLAKEKEAKKEKEAERKAEVQSRKAGVQSWKAEMPPSLLSIFVLTASVNLSSMSTLPRTSLYRSLGLQMEFDEPTALMCKSESVASSRLLYCLYTRLVLIACMVMDELAWCLFGWLFLCTVWCFRLVGRYFLPQDRRIPHHQHGCTAVVLIFLSLFPAPAASAVAVIDFDLHMDPGSYPDEVSWRIGQAGPTYSYSASPQTISLESGEQTLHMLDSFGDGWNGATWTLKTTGSNVVVAGPFALASGYSGAETFTAWSLPTAGPAAAPTKFGDTLTSAPTVAPTAAPSNDGDTHSPTSAPTVLHTDMPTFDPATTWVQLKTQCESSACSSDSGGCTIVLSDGFVMGEYSGQIAFAGKEIVLWAQGKMFDAGGGGQFFYADGAGTLELHSAVLTNGHHTLGGAINVNGANLKINGTIFLSNTAYGYGGTICIDNGSLVIHDSTFDANTAYDGGGAISADGSAAVEIYTSKFQTNAAGSGGAIDAYGSGVKVEIHDTKFISNGAATYGGAIYIEAGTLVIHDSTFDTNTADDDDGGGAIFAYGSAAVEIYTSKFQTNAAGSGGAMFAYGDVKVEIHDTKFISNEADDWGGGAIYIYANGGAEVEIYTSELNTNQALGRGGAIYASSGVVVKIYTSNFVGNTAGSYPGGGAVYASGSGVELEIRDTKFISNEANNHAGGAIAASNVAGVEIYTCTFESNTAALGGAIFIDEGSLVIHDSAFASNTAVNEGNDSCEYANDGVCDVPDDYCAAGTDNSDCSSISSICAGPIPIAGPIPCNYNSDCIGSHCVPRAGEWGEGGAIWCGCTSCPDFAITNAVVEIYSSTFKNNIATYYGGAVYTFNAEATIYTSTFEGNIAHTGGVIAASDNVEIYTSTFQANSASLGGAIIVARVGSGVDRVKLEIHNADFISNEVLVACASGTNFGGQCTSTVEDTPQSHDTECPGSLCSGAFGGAIYVFNGVDVKISASMFDSNTALGGKGGAIVSAGGSLVIHDSTFGTNIAWSFIFRKGKANDIYANSGAVVGASACAFGNSSNSTVTQDDSPRLISSGATIQVLQSEFSGDALSEGDASFYCLRGYIWKPAEGRCVACQSGQYNGNGVKNMTAWRQDASVRTSSTEACGSCTTCPAGRYGNTTASIKVEATTSCTRCPAGKYSPEEDHGPGATPTACKLCATGRYGQYEGEIDGNCTAKCPISMAITCSAGTSSPDYPIAGHYLANITNNIQEPCPLGKYKEGLDFSECESCPAGKYTAARSSMYCRECPVGYYSTNATSRLCSTCNSTTAEYQHKAGQQSCLACDSCSKGVRTGCGGTTAGYCSDCIPGQYADDVRLSCIECPSGKYQANANELACEQCAAGEYQEQAGQPYCLQCRAGYLANTGPSAGASNCTPCTPGRYSGSSSDEACATCTAGSITNTATKVGASTCTECTAGQFSVAPTDNDGCAACAPGKYAAADGSTACTRCPSGKYQDVVAQIQCKGCRAGTKRNASDDRSACIRCDAGMYQNIEEQTSCLACDKGKLQAELGQALCNICPAGYFNAAQWLSQCHSCSGGRFSGSASTSCISCYPGRASASAAPECGACEEGSYCPEGTSLDTMQIVNGSMVMEGITTEHFEANIKAQFTKALAVILGIPADAITLKVLAASTSLPATATITYAITLPVLRIAAPAQAPITNDLPDDHNVPSTSLMDMQQFVRLKIESVLCGADSANEIFDKNTTIALSNATDGEYILPSTPKCPSGKYAIGGECLDCAPGRFSGSGDTKCADCETGMYARAKGTKNCSSCPNNYYQQETGSTQCERCQDLAVTTASGSTSVDNCKCEAAYFLCTNAYLGGCRQGKCTTCPSDAVCSLGETLQTLESTAGFWRATENTTVFHRCPQPEACAGGQIIGGRDGQCAPGYLGIRCELCDRTSGYAVHYSPLKVCSKCGENEGVISIAVTTGAFLVMLLLIWICTATSVVTVTGGKHRGSNGKLLKLHARDLSAEIEYSVHLSDGIQWRQKKTRVGKALEMKPLRILGKDLQLRRRFDFQETVSLLQQRLLCIFSEYLSSLDVCVIMLVFVVPSQSIETENLGSVPANLFSVV
jgi:predicted outer membrane repeat protein